MFAVANKLEERESSRGGGGEGRGAKYAWEREERGGVSLRVVTELTISRECGFFLDWMKRNIKREAELIV